MDRLLENRRYVAAIAVGLVTVLLVSQLLAVATAPPSGISSTGRTIGRASFAYLGGLRTYAAAVLWTRLDAQYDDYIEGQGVGFKDLIYLLPTIYFVTRLDPQLVQAYYVGAYLLSDRHKWGQAIALARQGIANNPRSGLARANLVQLLIKQDKKKNLKEALAQTLVGIGPNMYYANPDDEFESLGIFRTALHLAGLEKLNAALAIRQEQLAGQGAKANALIHGGRIRPAQKP